MQGRSLMKYKRRIIFQQTMRHTKCRCKSVSGTGKGTIGPNRYLTPQNQLLRTSLEQKVHDFPYRR